MLVHNNTGRSFPWGVAGGRSGQHSPLFPCNPAAPQNYAGPTLGGSERPYPQPLFLFSAVFSTGRATSLLFFFLIFPERSLVP